MKYNDDQLYVQCMKINLSSCFRTILFRRAIYHGTRALFARMNTLLVKYSYPYLTPHI